MKNKRKRVECECNLASHSLVMDYDPYDKKRPEKPFASLNFPVKCLDNFWKRLFLGLKYIFTGKTVSFDDSWDNLVLDKNNATQLRNHLNGYLTEIRKYENAERRKKQRKSKSSKSLQSRKNRSN